MLTSDTNLLSFLMPEGHYSAGGTYGSRGRQVGLLSRSVRATSDLLPAFID